MGMVDIAFVVGEDYSGKKVLRLQKMLEQMQALGLFDSQSVNIDVIQGYGTDKKFSKEGLEYFSRNEELEAELDKSGLGDGVDEVAQAGSRVEVTDFYCSAFKC